MFTCSFHHYIWMQVSSVAVTFCNIVQRIFGSSKNCFLTDFSIFRMSRKGSALSYSSEGESINKQKPLLPSLFFSIIYSPVLFHLPSLEDAARGRCTSATCRTTTPSLTPSKTSSSCSRRLGLNMQKTASTFFLRRAMLVLVY